MKAKAGDKFTSKARKAAMTSIHDFPSPPFEQNVSSPYGASMGRPSEAPTGLVRIVRVPFVDGDYDPGGAYWGGGTPLWCAWDQEGQAIYIRAKNLDDATAKLPMGCIVYREGDVISEQILKGMVTILWDDAWAMHAEEHHCYNLSGCDVMTYMPTPPDEALTLAADVLGAYEKKNNCSIAELFWRAEKAEGRSCDPERFGECLAWMAVGAGVSWFDDHEEFAIEVPYVENDLRFVADAACKVYDPSPPYCEECGAYVEGGEKCGNCSHLEN